MRWTQCAVILCVLTPCAVMQWGCDDPGAVSLAQMKPTADTGGADAGSADAAPVDAGLVTVDLGPPPSAASCFSDIGGDLGPNYDQFGPTVGRHCHGTNHQDITGVERVVFLGDSVTYGTPPTLAWEFYRVLLADGLKARFGEDLVIDNCAVLGARTDDFLRQGGQVPECFPEGGDDRRTLVIFTMGGNDIAAWAGDAASVQQALGFAREAADLLEDTIAWFKAPGRFPNGIFVVYANPYEFTDATGDLESCELAAAAGFSGNWIEGASAVIRFNERYMQIAVDHQVDMIFTLEAFCGHGFRADDPDGPCYRGRDAEVWFDLTCIHPNTAGHRVIADMFLAVVDE